LKGKKTLADIVDPVWQCQLCTFLNEDMDAKVCAICLSARSPESLAERELQKQQLQQTSNAPWPCAQCTFFNGPHDTSCQVCGASKASSEVIRSEANETERGGRQFELIHVDGLEKTIGGQVYPPRKTNLRLTTVDAFLAGPGSSGFGSPFEEVLQTKWPGALFDYGQGGHPPSIEG